MMTQVVSPRSSSLDEGIPLSSALEQLVNQELKQQRVKQSLVLTKEDKELLMLNSESFNFSDGEICMNKDSGNDIYFIAIGSIELSDKFGKIMNLGSGNFIVYKEWLYTAKAVGNLVMRRINKRYVFKMLEGDVDLALRYWRRVAITFATLIRGFLDVNADFAGIARTECSLNIKPKSLKSPNTPRSRKSIAQVFHCSIGSQNVNLKIKDTKLKLSYNTVVGLHKKKKYRYSDIKTVVRSSDISITIITKHMKGKTIFMNNKEITSKAFELLSNVSKQASTPVRPDHSHTPLTQSNQTPLKIERGDDGSIKVEGFDFSITEEDRKMMLAISEVIVYKKGDTVYRAGDLYQRVFQIEEGTCDIMHAGIKKAELSAGDSVGELSIVQLRPFELTIVVSSDELTIRVVTGVKILDLISRNKIFGTRFFRDVAMQTEKKLNKLIQHRQRSFTS